MAANPVLAELLTPFDPDAGVGDLQLLIEHDPLGKADLDVHLLLFPAVNAQVLADVGQVRTGNTKSVDVPPGVLEFQGSSIVQIPKRPSEAPEFRVLRASDANGANAPISISFDASTGVLRASSECVGAVAYSAYRAHALELIYRPQVQRTVTGTVVTFGTIVAFYPPRSQTTYQVQPFEVDQGNVELELYRIVSNSVVNRDGEFEKPPNYPASGEYPDRALVIDTSITMETQRVHEIGYMDLKRKFGWARVYLVPTLEPYVGNTSYVPTKRLIESSLPDDKFTKDEIAAAKNFITQRGYRKL